MNATTPAARLTVPYITAYSDEVAPHPLAFVRDAGTTDGWRVSYTDAVEQDSMFGVLWARHGLHKRGRPEWKMVNTLRQRRCMLHMLCQVCGGPATAQDGRISWVLADDPDDPGGHPADTGYTNAPPTCSACVDEAISSCPRLRRGASVYTVASTEPYGVLANVLSPSRRSPVTRETGVVIPLDAYHRLEYALAVQLLVKLEGLQPAHI